MTTKSISVTLKALTGDYTRALADAAQKTRKYMGDIQRSAAKNSEGFTTLGMGVTAAGAAITASIGLAARSAISFESSFAGVRKTVDASEADLARLSQGFRDMALEIPVTANELNRIGEAAGQLGIENDNILGFTRIMADLGATTNLSSDQAATALARLANITQMSQEDFGRLGSTIVDLGNKFETTEAEIVEMGLRIAGAGAQIGLSEAEILSVAAALSSVGIEAEAGGTAISRVMVELANAVASGGDSLAQFGAVADMSADQFKAAFNKDAAGATVAFVEGLGRIADSGENVFAVLEEMEMSDIRVRDALLRAAGAGDLLRDSLNTGRVAWEENLALTDEAAKRYETAESRIQLAKNALTDFAIEIGNVVLPAVTSLADKGASLMKFFSDLPGPVKATGTVVGLLVGGVALLGGSFLLLLPRIAATKAAMVDLGITAATTRSALSMTAGVLGGPWGIAIAGATAAIGIFGATSSDTKRNVEDLTAAIEADSGALAENSRAYVNNKLHKEGYLQTAREMGVAVDDFVSAAMGDEAALRRVGQATDATIAAKKKAGDESQDWLQKEAQLYLAIGRTADELDAATTAAALKAEGMGKSARASDKAAGAISGLGGAADLTTASVEDLTDAVFGLADAEAQVADAEDALIDARAEYNDLLKEGAVDEEAVADARDRLADATRGVESAERRLADAHERLNDLLNPSAVDAEDTAIARARAMEEIAEAERRLSTVRAAGGSPTAITEAELDLRDARLALAKIDEESAENSDAIAEARADVTAAEEDLTKAQRDEKKALEELAKAQAGDEDWSRKVEKAKRNVESAERDVVEALIDSEAAFATQRDLLADSATNAAALRDRLDELAARYPQHAGIIGELMAGLPAPVPNATSRTYEETYNGRRAAGGPVSAGGTYIVGEKQPEVLKLGMDGNGYVYPSLDNYARTTGATLSPMLIGGSSVTRQHNVTTDASMSIGTVVIQDNTDRALRNMQRRRRLANLAAV